MTRSKKRRNQSNHTSEDHEIYQYGPLVLERAGKQIIMRNNSTPEEHAAFIEKARQYRPELHESIDSKLARLKEIVDSCKPMEILAALNTSYILLAKGRDGVKCHFAEFILSVVTADPEAHSSESATEQAIEEAQQLVEEIHNAVQAYFSSEVAERGTATPEDGIRHSAILNWLYVRGEAYPKHYQQLIRDEFTPHDTILASAHSITTENIIQFSESIMRQIENSAEQTGTTFAAALESQKLFEPFVDTHDFKTVDEMRDAFNELPEVKKISEMLGNVPECVFEIQPDDLPPAVIDALTLKPGDNQPFRFSRSDLWPTNGSLIYEKPLTRLDGKLYCFIPQTFSMNLRRVLQMLLKSADSTYFLDNYRKKRGELLEQQSIELLAEKLPGAQVYRNVYYRIQENGENKRPEADGIILFDGFAIIVEAKGAELTESGRRGGLNRLRKDLGEIATKGQSQHSRTINYIVQNEKPIFENKNGSQAFELDKDKFPHLIPIVTSLENLSYLMSSMKDMVELGIVAAEPMPWFVSLNDLRVITDIVESPAQLIQYIERRRRSYAKAFYHSMDELDSFGHYLKEGLYFEEIEGTIPNMIMFNGYSEPIDKYYESDGPKPALNVPAGSKDLVESVETSGLEGRTEIAISILEGDSDSQNTIAGKVTQALNMTEFDGADHAVTVVSTKDDTVGLTVATYLGDEVELRRVHAKYVGYCSLKKYQLKKDKWALVVINQAQPEKVRIVDKLDSPWEFNEDLEDRVTRFASRKVDLALVGRKKIGRNELCPCNSGKKYKYCCIDK